MERLRNTPNPAIFELDNIKMNTDKITTLNGATSAIRNQFYIVGAFSVNGGVSFSPNPTIHTSASDARLECKRLAVNTPGKLYLFVKLSGAEFAPASITTSY